MGSGNPRRNIKRGPAEGVSDGGVSTVGCPPSGQVEVAPTPAAKSGVEGRLLAVGSGIDFVSGSQVLANAPSSPALVHLIACLKDGVHYQGRLTKPQNDRWIVRYRQA